MKKTAWSFALACLLSVVCGSARAQLQTITGTPLRIELTDTSGKMKVFRLFGTNEVYTREYFSTFSTYLQLVNGTTTNRFTGAYTAVSNGMPDASTIQCVYDASNTGVRVTQILEYQNGKAYFKKQWRVSNPTSTNYTDVRLLHGGDTYFANSDSASGYWDTSLNMVYLKNPGTAGLMGFYGAYGSRANQYYEGNLSGLSAGMTAFNLPNTSDTNFLDCGYALQWNTNLLATGAVWTVTAYEKWTEAGDVQVLAGANGEGIVTTTTNALFTVVNFQTNADTFSLTPALSQAGWTVALPGGTNLPLAAGVSTTLAAQVTIGSITQCLVSLLAVSQTDAGISNSDSLTISGLAGNPYWTSTPVTNATDGDLYTYTLAAADTNAYAVNFSAGSLPSWLALTGIAGGGIISTYAGNGQNGYATNGTAATNMPMRYPYGMACDAAGNLFYADYCGHLVRRIGTDGRVTTVAGKVDGSSNALYGFSGDGGPATNALLNYPQSVALDAAGNLYVIDRNNQRIRRVGTNGIITTVAGSGSADAYGNYAGAYSGDGGAATNARLNYPQGIAVDAAGNVYIADRNNQRVRRVGTNGVIATVAGSGSPDGYGNINGGYSGDGGAATNAQLSCPQGVAVDAAGNLFIADIYNRRVRRVDTNGVITTIAGNGQSESRTISGDGQAATSVGVGEVADVKADSAGTVYFLNSGFYMMYGGNSRVRKIDAEGKLQTVAGKFSTDPFYYFRSDSTGDGGPATNATFRYTYGLVFDRSDNLYISEGYGNRIRKVTSTSAGWRLSGTPGPEHVGTTNSITLYATNCSGITPQIFTLTVAGRARPLVYAGGSVISNGMAANSALGTDFGTVGTNTSRTLTLSLTNFGTATLQITGVSTTGQGAAYFTVSNLPAAVAVGTASNFSIRYAPGALGAHLAAVSIANNGTNTPYVINVAGTGIRPGLIGLNRASLAFTSTYGGGNPAAQAFVVTNTGGAGFDYTNIPGAAWLTVAPPTGSVAAAAARTHTGTVSVAGLNAGTYTITNTISSTNAGNSPVDMAAQLTIAQASQSIISFPSVSNQVITNVVGLRATASSGLPASFGVVRGPGTISGGTNLAFTAEGTVWVRASQTGSVNYAAAPPLTNGIAVSRMTATLTLTNLSQVFDGNAKTATVTTVPAGLPYAVSYGGGAAPFAAGSYSVMAMSMDSNYSGSASGTLTIAKADQTVSFPAIPDQNITNRVGLSATATSSNAVTFSVLAGQATIAGGTNLSFSGAGQVRVTANQAGDNNWNPAPTVTNSIGVYSMPVWTSTPVTNATDGALYAYTLAASDPGGASISFSASNLPSWLTLASIAGGGIISTYAGTGQNGYATNGTPATNMPMRYPYGMACDAAGNLFYADYGGHLVRRIGTDGLATTVAGKVDGSSNALYGFSGDGGPATNALLNYPQGVALDTAGNLYVTDRNNHRIRRIGTNGIITTLAGSGTSDGNGSMTGAYSGDGGAATNARLNSPQGVALDAAGNVYVVDRNNQRVRRIGTDGIITTVAGTGTPDAYGNVPSGFAGDGGAATNAQLSYPQGVAVDAAGNLYIADTYNRRLRRVNTNGVITTIAGNGQSESRTVSGDGQAATNVGIGEVADVKVDSAGTVYFLNSGYYMMYGGNSRVRKIDADGNLQTVAGKFSTDPFYYYRSDSTGDGGPATNATFRYTAMLAFDRTENLYISEGYGNRIRKVTSTAAGWRLSGTPGPEHVGTTNIRLYASNGSRSTLQAFDLVVAGLGRPLIRTALGAVVSNNAPSAASPGTDFGTVATNASRTLNLSLTNYGTATLQVTGVSTTGAGAAYFTISNLPAAVAVGAASNFSITYRPTGLGAHLAAVTITNNGTNTPYVINLAGAGIRPGLIGLNRASLAFTATYGGTNPAGQAFVITNTGGAAFDYTNAPGAAWLTVAPATGSLAAAAARTHTGTVSIAGLNAGAYAITNTVVSTNAGNSPVDMAVQLTLAQASQTITFPALSNQAVTATVGLSATASSGLPVVFSVASGPGTLSGGTNLACTAAGTIWVVASQTGSVNYAAAAPVTNRLDVTRIMATVTLTNLNQVYDGSIKTATVATVPAGLSVQVTYAGQNAPSNAGSYAVQAALDATNYQGGATGTLVIAKADQTISGFGALAPQHVTNRVGLSATASSGLAVSYQVVSGPGAVNGTNLTFSTIGTVLVKAMQLGNTNWNAAPMLTNAVTVYSVPVWSSTPVTNATDGALYSYSPLASEPAGLPLTYSAPTLPAWLALTTNAAVGCIANFAGIGSAGLNGDGAAATNAMLSSPYDAAVDGLGNVYIADYANSRVRKVSSNGIMATLAGLGENWAGNGFSGDNGPAQSAALSFPMGVAADSAGRVYIADSQNARVRLVDTNGIISTVAGVGSNATGAGYSGDGGPANAAKLSSPAGVGLDRAGNVYIADTGNSRIRRVDALSGIISTVAGMGSNYTGAGYSGDGGPATNALLNFPAGAVVGDNGDIYIADTKNHLVRRIDTNGIIRTLAGQYVTNAAGAAQGGYSGDGGPAVSARLNQPCRAALDKSGNLYIADAQNHVVRRVDTNGIIRTVSGRYATNQWGAAQGGYSGDGGPATNAEMNCPSGLAADGNGGLYIADQLNHRVRRLDVSGAAGIVLSGTPNATHVGATNVVLAANNGYSNATQSFAVQVAGRARPLVLNASGAVISNSAAPSSALGTDFGTVATNEERTLTLTITNVGSTALLISGISTSGPGAEYVTVSNLPATVGMGAASNFVVRYAPLALAPHAVSVTLTHNGTNTPYVVRLGGTGVKPGSIWLDRGTLSYQAAYGGANPASDKYTITNHGAAPFGYSNTVTYDGSASGWLSVAAPTGYLAIAGVQVHTGSVSIAGINAGVYYATNRIMSATAENSPVDLLAVQTINQAAQAITFPSISNQAVTSVVTLAATASSGLPVSYRVAEGPALLNGSNLSFYGNGTIRIAAGQTGNVNYAAASETTNAFVASLLQARLALTNLDQVYDGSAKTATVVVTPAGLNVQVTYAGSTTAPVNPGAYAVNATITSDNYSGNVQDTLRIAKAPQTVNFPSIPDQWITNRLSLTASASSGLPVTFAVVSGPATLSAGSNLTFTAAGQVRVAARQAGNEFYADAGATNTFQVLRINQAITFPAIPGQAVTGVVALAATASSGLPVSFAVVAGPATIGGGTQLSFTAAGTVRVMASQTGDTQYAAAPDITNMVAVSKSHQTLAFPAIPDQAVTGVVALAATASSGLPVSFAVGSGPGAISGGNRLSFTATGLVAVLASQAGDARWAAAPTATNTVRVYGEGPQPTNELPAPKKVAAEVEGSTNMIHVTWQGVAGATAYELWRGTNDNTNAAVLLATVPASQSVRGQSHRDQSLRGQSVSLQSLNRSSSESLTYSYDDYEVLPAVTYYYWVRATAPDAVSAFSYAAMGALRQGPEESEGTCDLAISDLVFLPVNLTNGTPAGTVSCRLANLGPDELPGVPVAFDFYLTGPDDYSAWIGSDTETVTLGAGQEGLLILTPARRAALRAGGDLSGTNLVRAHARHASRRYDPDLANNTTTGPGLVRVKTGGANSPGRSPNDYDGDGKADAAVTGPDGAWHIALSGSRFRTTLNGWETCHGFLGAAGDYDADGVSDTGIYDPATGLWFAWLSGARWQRAMLPFVPGGQVAAAADYDGDGKTDPTLYSAEAGYWLVLRSGSGYRPAEFRLGGPGTAPAAADYDGDRLADPAAYAEPTGQWIVALSSRGHAQVAGGFGAPGFAAAPADYDGDGKADLALYQASGALWCFLLSNWAPEIFQGYTPAWGVYGDAQALCAAADYDGDGKTDPATYLPETGAWKLYLSSQGYALVTGVYGGSAYTPERE